MVRKRPEHSSTTSTPAASQSTSPGVGARRPGDLPAVDRERVAAALDASRDQRPWTESNSSRCAPVAASPAISLTVDELEVRPLPGGPQREPPHPAEAVDRRPASSPASARVGSPVRRRAPRPAGRSRPAARAPLDRHVLRVLQVPVEVALAGNVGAFVAAAHRHDDVGPFRHLPGQQLRPRSERSMPISAIASTTAGWSRSAGWVPAASAPWRPAAARSKRARLICERPGVVQADEEHVRHQPATPTAAAGPSAAAANHRPRAQSET